MTVRDYPEAGGIAILHAGTTEEAAREFVRYAESEPRCAVAVANGYVARMRDCLLRLAKAPDALIVGGNEHCAIIVEMHWLRPDGFTLNLENCVAIDGTGMNGDLVGIIDENTKERTLTNLEAARDSAAAMFKERGETPSSDELSEGARALIDNPESGLDAEPYYTDTDFRPHKAGTDPGIINADLRAFLAGGNLLANHLNYDFLDELKEIKKAGEREAESD